DQNGDGYVEYQSASEKGLVNQGWKDSGNAVVNTDGTLAQPPISLTETSLAGLYAQAGEAERAAQLQREAQQLRVQFNRDFSHSTELCGEAQTWPKQPLHQCGNNRLYLACLISMSNQAA